VTVCKIAVNVQGSGGRAGRDISADTRSIAMLAARQPLPTHFPPPKGRTLRLQTGRCSVWQASFSAFPNAQIHNATNGTFYVPSCRELSAGPARVCICTHRPNSKGVIYCLSVCHYNLWPGWTGRPAGSLAVEICMYSAQVTSAGHLPALTSFVRNRLKWLKVWPINKVNLNQTKVINLTKVEQVGRYLAGYHAMQLVTKLSDCLQSSPGSVVQ